MVQAVIVVGYLVVLLVLGAAARWRARPGAEDFFLASRSLGPMLLFLTMAATNFSAFTVLGFSGAGYRIGYAYYPVMAFGTGFMALTFVLLGVPLWRAARRLGAITPPEVVWLHFRHRPLHVAYLAVMVVFTLPYLALQPLGAGYALQELLGVPHAWGATLVTGVGLAYVLFSGMRGDAWTDALQGVLMLAAMLAVFFGTAHALGGFAVAQERVLALHPELFTRPGGGAALPPGVWFSYMALWFLCDPMFPQLFQRFLAARDEGALRKTMLFYPLVTGVLFFLPVAVGVMGRLVVPGLEGAAADRVLPMVVDRLLPPWVGALVLVGALAALMSTMDSQLLTLSSMAVRDGATLAGDGPMRRLLRPRLVLAALAGAGLALALRPWAPILEIATETFTGLAVLFPVTLAMLYWPRTSPGACFAAILVGEALVALHHFKALPTFGLLPVIPVVTATTIVLLGGTLLAPARGREALARVSRRGLAWTLVFAGAFALGHDFWSWGRIGPLWLGLPGWLWYFFGLNLLVFGLFLGLARGRDDARLPEGPAAH